jgi:hypothetical protein
MSEPFDVAVWYASMHEAGQDIRAIEFVEHDLQLIVVGRPYDHARDEARWAALVDHRDAVIAYLSARQRQEEAA